MRPSCVRIALAVVCAGIGASALLPVSSASAQRSERRAERDGGVEISGRPVSCRNVRIVYDRRLPSEGAAAPGVLILNPRMLNEQPEIVRLFVFHHECGHHQVGESELKADCWAVEQGVHDGWLDEKGLKEVCQSFDGAPETPTHPSARRRCRNLDQCFATAVASRPQRRPVLTAAAVAGRQQPNEPKLVRGPTLIGTGTVRFTAGKPCPQPSSTLEAADRIADLLQSDAARPAHCP